MPVTEHLVGFRVPSAASWQCQNLLNLQNAEFSFTDTTILCQLGRFIPFHGFLVEYFNQGDDPIHPNYPESEPESYQAQVVVNTVNNHNQQLTAQTGTGTETVTGTASDSVINLENYPVVEVAQAVLFLYVGKICLWPTSITRFIEILLALGCNPSRVLIMGPMSFALYDHMFGSPALTETAGGQKLRFWSNNNGVLTAHFIYANGISHIEGYSVSS